MVNASEPRAPSRSRLVVIPSVDVLGHEAVRLRRGQFSSIQVRAGDPVRLAAEFARLRPAFVHLVDLDGARSGAIRADLVRAVSRAAAPVPLQAAGGIRSPEDVRAVLAAGAARVVVGTAAFAGRGALEQFAEFGDQVIIAIDIRAGHVAIEGWERSANLSAVEAVERCEGAGVRRLLCTAIERDGTMSGPDLRLLESVVAGSGARVLAAGGIRSTRDLDRLAAVGVEGAVVGRALLEGNLPLSVLDSGA